MVSSAKQQEWNKAGEDVVVLHQFPRCFKSPNFSPYCLKLETFLRAYKLNYVVEEEFALKGPTKQAPWMTFNGVNTGDSQVCIKLLADKFKINYNAGLTEGEESVSEAFRALIEDRLIPMLALERFAFFKWDDYKDISQPLFPPIMQFASNFIWGRMGAGMKKANGPVGKLTEEQLANRAYINLKTLSQYLGNKKFFFGDDMTLLDMIVFGYATQILVNTPASSKMRQKAESFENLVQHHQTMKKTVFPDWDDLLFKGN